MPPVVAFVLPELGPGGAERTILNVLNHLDRSLFTPTLFLYRHAGVYLPLLSEDVEVHALAVPRARRSIVPLARTLRQRRPAVVVSTILHVNVATSIARRLALVGVPGIVRETNHHSAAGRGRNTLGDRLVGWSYRTADAVVALSEGVRADVLDRYEVNPDRVSTIHNPIDIEQVRERARADAPPIRGWTDAHDELRIVAVGKLERQKGFDLLLHAVAGLDLPWRLLIVGAGSREGQLRGESRDLGISDRVHFAGHLENPLPYMAAADLFVLSSRWEGFGHVITESMVCGTAVLAARCPAGPDEIIDDGVDGRLCEPESVASIRKGIEELAHAPETRAAMVSAAAQSVRRFDVRAIAREWEQLLARVIAR